MIGWIIVLGLIVIGVLVYYIWFSDGKGTTIYVNLVEDHDGKLVEIYPKKVIKAKQYRNDSGIEVLRLPRKYSQEVVEGIGTKHLNLTNAGTPKVTLLKVAEEIYVPLMARKVTNKLVHTDLIDNRDATAFYIDELRRNAERYKNKQSFFEKYGALVGVAFVGVILLISIIFITKFATEQIEEARTESQKMTDKILDTFRGFTGQETVNKPKDTESPRPIGNTGNDAGE